MCQRVLKVNIYKIVKEVLAGSQTLTIKDIKQPTIEMLAKKIEDTILAKLLALAQEDSDER